MGTPTVIYSHNCFWYTEVREFKTCHFIEAQSAETILILSYLTSSFELRNSNEFEWYSQTTELVNKLANINGYSTQEVSDQVLTGDDK
jgi:hypothetical protein